MKKILFLIFSFLFLIFPGVFSAAATTIQVENIFSDIDADYQYYSELQTFYERGMISPDSEGKFSPFALLERDEFVGISMEVACERCIQPHTEFKFIEKYWGQDVYFDINPDNKHFYCIAEADDKDFVKGYDAGFTCENGVSRNSERPFCPQNTITLEESIAVLLRNSGVFTIEDNQAVMQDILAGNITENLSDDVSPTNPDGTPYTFYGYLRKALEFELVEFDTDGNEKVYKMLEIVDGKIRPKKGITKEEFLLLSYIAFKSNSCGDITSNTIALDMSILPTTCSEGSSCSSSDISAGDIEYDFSSDVRGFCEEGIDDPDGYIWRFHNRDTGTRFFQYGQYIDNQSFTPAGNWDAYLRVIDNCGNTGEVRSTFVSGNPDADSLVVNIDDEVDDREAEFTGVATGGTGPYTYEWDFGDGSAGSGETVNHTYEPGVYEVTLTVTDADGNTQETTTTVVVGDADNLIVDIDDEVDDGDAEFVGVATGGSGPYTYEWDFGDGSTGSGEAVNHTYEPGIYEVTLTVTDADGNTEQTNETVVVGDADNLIADIEVDTLIGFEDLIVGVQGVVVGGVGPYTYEWNFGDGGTDSGVNFDHIYDTPGVYEIILLVTDADGNTGESTVLIQVLVGDSCDKDSDGDGIVDCEDKCPSIAGVSDNLGCPILDDGTTEIADISSTIEGSCIYDSSSAKIVGNAVCNSCPCANFANFLADIRACDIIFPAITSPDASTIYSKGKSLQIR